MIADNDRSIEKISRPSGFRCFTATRATKYSRSLLDRLASLSFVPLFVPVSPWIVTCTLSVYQETRVSTSPPSPRAREGKFSFLPNSFSSSAAVSLPSSIPLREKLESPGFTTGHCCHLSAQLPKLTSRSRDSQMKIHRSVRENGRSRVLKIRDSAAPLVFNGLEISRETKDTNY